MNKLFLKLVFVVCISGLASPKEIKAICESHREFENQ